MAQFDSFVIDGLPQLKRALDPNRWWDALERALPAAMEPVRAEMSALAPKGRTGKLSGSVKVTIRRFAQGLIRGVEVLLGVGVPYGHLVESGHNIIARGPSRSGLTKSRRAELRTGLQKRQGNGPIGFVAARPFAQPATMGHQSQVIAQVEQAMRTMLAA